MGSALAGDCNWKMPVDEDKCEQVIKWRTHNDKQALATCLEHFPTTFVERKAGETSTTEVTCIVYRQFQCNFMPGSVPIFDKCYKFDEQEITMKEYLAAKGNTPKCAKDGSLPVFFTMTQAKHIAYEAHRRKIFKMWVNIDSNGKTIENSQFDGIDQGYLLYKDQWKLHQNHHWVGDNLEATPKVDDKHEAPSDAQYLFFRTQNDYWNKLNQGSFERATEDSKASVVCEYQAKIVPESRKYCDKMKKLTLNARYDNNKCLYTTLTYFPLKGNEAAIEAFTGCNEKPSEEHSSGLDDGTSSASVYSDLTSERTYRLAAIKADLKANSRASQSYTNYARAHCENKNYGPDVVKKQRQPYEIFSHYFDKDYAVRMKSPWEDAYPKDECSDFPNSDMYSKTLAIRKGKIIDVPTPVLLPAICSIASNIDCERAQRFRKAALCNRRDLFCKNTQTWNEELGLYAKCECPEFHKEVNNVCKFTLAGSGIILNDGGTEDKVCTMNTNANERSSFTTVGHFDIRPEYNNAISKTVVRNGCNIRFYARPASYGTGSNNEAITPLLEVGEHEVPNEDAGTLRGWEGNMGASSYECRCPDPQ